MADQNDTLKKLDKIKTLQAKLRAITDNRSGSSSTEESVTVILGSSHFDGCQDVCLLYRFERELNCSLLYGSVECTQPQMDTC